MAVQSAPKRGQFKVHAAQRFIGVVDGLAGNSHRAWRSSVITEFSLAEKV
jgi:hypothetical protein